MGITKLLENSVQAKTSIANASIEQKNLLLETIAASLLANQDLIIAANAKDIEAAKASIGEVMIDRLRLNEQRIRGMAENLAEVVEFADPCNEVLETVVRPNGLVIKKVRVPLGVVAIIYESRPNVTVDAAALCIKSGNVCILRGGKEAFYSNNILCDLIREAAKKTGFDENIVTYLKDKTRVSTNELMLARDYVDLLIPRGGAGLIKAVVANAKVPIIETGTGNCHLYVDKDADLKMALKILINGKTQRVSVCNALEKCLVHEAIADRFLPMLKNAMDEKNVELRLDSKALKVIAGNQATELDYATEFLDYILAVKVVSNLDEAIAHINQYSTKHSEAIVTTNSNTADKFLQRIDASCVYVNASTRFTDGSEFGKGLEMGISTQKVGARGPMGAKEIMTYKYLIYGNGQIR